MKRAPVGWLLCTALLCGFAGMEVSSSDQARPEDWQPDRRPLATTLVYECDDGFEFVARLGPGEMAVWLAERYAILSRVPSASGAKYQEGDLVFWSKGDEAMLTVGGDHHRNCRLVPERAPWEDARRRAVDFRAVGQEAGWYLEMKRDKQILFVGEYHTLRVLTPWPAEERSGDTLSYHAVTDAHDLLVEIEDEPCTDTMSGERFPSRVTVALDGIIYRGCGRALDHPWE
jgi:membrane-bound inhibitor of C-type lysozyme